MKRLNDWFEIDEHEYLMYLLKGYEIKVDDRFVAWEMDDELHREDGPAVIYSDGYKAWYINGKCHRESGPAVITEEGINSWYLNDKHYRTEAEYNEAIKLLV